LKSIKIKKMTELEGRMDGFEKNQVRTKETLGELVTLVKEMNKGLYGDERNKHTGVIDRQYQLEKKIDDLELMIHAIIKKNNEQDIEIGARKYNNREWLSWGKIIFIVASEIIFAYAIYKGIVSADALHRTP